jgi:hypothetical protein
MSLANALTAQYADMRENSVIESGDFRLLVQFRRLRCQTSLIKKNYPLLP